MTNLAALLVDNLTGSTFITIDTSTAPKLTGGKKNPFQERVEKLTIGSSVMMCTNRKTSGYEDLVNHRLVAEGKDPDFTVGPRQWGYRIANTCFVEHKGKYYIEVIFLKPGKTEYYVDGVLTPKSTITGLEVDKEEGKQGGLDDKVIIRTYSVDSIKSITINNRRYDDLEFDLSCVKI